MSGERSPGLVRRFGSGLAFAASRSIGLMKGDLGERDDPALLVADIDADALNGAVELLVFGGGVAGEISQDGVVK